MPVKKPQRSSRPPRAATRRKVAEPPVMPASSMPEDAVEPEDTRAPEAGVVSEENGALSERIEPAFRLALDDEPEPEGEVDAETSVEPETTVERPDRRDRVAATPAERVSAEIIALERAALDRWGAGDPSGFLEICAPDVVYFDPFLDMRIDGLEALTMYYEAIRGKIRIDRYELLNPRVQSIGRMAVLTFNYISYGGNENKFRWNCTEAYRKDAAGWRIVQTHWSFTNPKK